VGSKAFGDGTKNYPTYHYLVDKTMNMCESYLTKTYLKVFGASSCRYIGIVGYLLYNQGNFNRFLENNLVIW
jgi:hypothetical protein